GDLQAQHQVEEVVAGVDGGGAHHEGGAHVEPALPGHPLHAQQAPPEGRRGPEPPQGEQGPHSGTAVFSRTPWIHCSAQLRSVSKSSAWARGSRRWAKTGTAIACTSAGST